MKRVNLFLVATFVVASAVFVGCDKQEKMEPEVQSHNGKVIATLEDEKVAVITEFIVVEDTPMFVEIDFETLEKILRSINEELMRSSTEKMMQSLMENSLLTNVAQPENAVEK